MKHLSHNFFFLHLHELIMMLVVMVVVGVRRGEQRLRGESRVSRKNRRGRVWGRGQGCLGEGEC